MTNLNLSIDLKDKDKDKDILPQIEIKVNIFKFIKIMQTTNITQMNNTDEGKSTIKFSPKKMKKE